MGSGQVRNLPFDFAQGLRKSGIRNSESDVVGMGGGIGSILYSQRRDNGSLSLKEFFTYNAVGDTVAMTDPSAVATKTDLYEAFGNISSSTGASENNRLANTKERSFSFNLDNHGMRYYDPEVGRYLTRDPIGYGDGLNVYLYVHNNPINFIDPLGLDATMSEFTDDEGGPEGHYIIGTSVVVKAGSDSRRKRLILLGFSIFMPVWRAFSFFDNSEWGMVRLRSPRVVRLCLS